MTPEQFKATLRQQGKTIREWADENGFKQIAVYRALNGVNKGSYGNAHAILVAAGIKEEPEPAFVERRAADRRQGERREGDRRHALAA